MFRINRINFISNLCSSVFICGFLLLFVSLQINAQDLPDKIRGYKVHRANILVQNTEETSEKQDDLRVEVNFDGPELVDFSLSGVKLELGGSFTIYGQSGVVDFISFKDFKVNDIKVEIEEYKDSFDFRKNETFELKKPVEIFVGTGQTLRVALKEWRESKEEWTVTGKVFVFGRFNKMGFKFKRVIPVEVNVKIKNPLLENK